jgi:hypothetical protein
MACQARELSHRGCVTVPAGGFMMIQKVLAQRDRMSSHKCPTRPGRGGVTLHAIRSKGTQVESWLSMAGRTICWDFELP